jgi:hypothetical protein
MKRAALFLLTLSACSWTGEVRQRASFDLQCPEPQIEVQTISSYGATYGARGCGRQATYVVRDGQTILNSPVTDLIAPGSSPSQPEQSEVKGAEEGTVEP